MVDFEVDASVLDDYFRADNNFQLQVEKRDDQREVTDKDDGEAPETSREEQFVDWGEIHQYNYEDEESEGEGEEWSPEEEAMYQTYCAIPSWKEHASTSSSTGTLNNSLADETDESEETNRYFFTNIKERESEKPLDLSEEEDEDDTEIIEKADIEPSEKSLLKAMKAIPSLSESCK